MADTINGLNVYERIANKLRHTAGQMNDGVAKEACLQVASDVLEAKDGFANLFGEQASLMKLDKNNVDGAVAAIQTAVETLAENGKNVEQIAGKVQGLAFERMPTLVVEGLAHEPNAHRAIESVVGRLAEHLPPNMPSDARNSLTQGIRSAAKSKGIEPVYTLLEALNTYEGSLRNAITKKVSRNPETTPQLKALGEQAASLFDAIKSVKLESQVTNAPLDQFVKANLRVDSGAIYIPTERFDKYIQNQAELIVRAVEAGNDLSRVIAGEAVAYTSFAANEVKRVGNTDAAVKLFALAEEAHTGEIRTIDKFKAAFESSVRTHTPKPKLKLSQVPTANDNTAPKKGLWEGLGKGGRVAVWIVGGVAALGTVGFASGAFRSNKNAQPNGQGVAGMSPEQQLRAGGDSGRKALADKVLEEKKYEKYGTPTQNKRPKVDLVTAEQEAESRNHRPDDKPKTPAGVGTEPAGQPRDNFPKYHEAMAAGAADVDTMIAAAEAANHGPVAEAPTKEVAPA